MSNAVNLFAPQTEELFLERIEEELEGERSWDAIDVALEDIVALGRPGAVRVLTRLMAHPDIQMRFRAAEKLATVEHADVPLRWLCVGSSEDVTLAAAWGLVKLGFHDPALRYLRTHGGLLVPRFIGLGPPGVRALCKCTPMLFGDGLDDAAVVLARKRQHLGLLIDLTADGSELARRAVDCMQRRRGVMGRWRLPLFGDEPLSKEERRELSEAGVDLRLLRRAENAFDVFAVDEQSPQPPPANRTREDTLWRPIEDLPDPNPTPTDKEDQDPPRR